MTATRAELDGMMEVMHAAFDPAFGEAWNERQLASSMLIPGTRFAMIDAAGVMGPPARKVPTAGFYLARTMCDEEELLLLAVAPEYRRHGFATRLMEHLFAAAADHGVNRVFLEMREDNDARHFYSRLDFQQVGLRRDYYRGADGLLRNAVTMSRTIAYFHKSGS